MPELTGMDILKRKDIRGTMKDHDMRIDQPVPRTWDELKDAKKKIKDAAAEDIERAFLLQALSRNNWNVTKTAQDTGLQRTNFQALMRKHHLHYNKEISRSY